MFYDRRKPYARTIKIFDYRRRTAPPPRKPYVTGETPLPTSVPVRRVYGHPLVTLYTDVSRLFRRERVFFFRTNPLRSRRLYDRCRCCQSGDATRIFTRGGVRRSINSLTDTKFRLTVCSHSLLKL